MVTVPTPDVVQLAIAIIFYIAGALTPYYYAQERLRGFGRFLAKRIPYEPPPGEHEDTAMTQATRAGRSSDAADEAQED